MRSVLIVDDSTVTRNHIERVVEQCNLQVVGQAENGFEALEQYRKLKPDLVTLDLTMPGMDGNECISKLIAENPQAVILVISAAADKEAAIAAIDAGACGFVNKPFEDETLAAAINATISTFE